MSDDADYLANYKANQLYTHPGKAGTYATIAGEGEEVLGEVDVTTRCKIAVSAFYVNDKADFGTFKITKLQHHASYGWREAGHIQVNHFHLAQINQFLSIISSVDLSDAKKARLSLGNLDVGALASLLNSTRGPELVEQLAHSPELHQDIYAIASKREALAQFKSMLGQGRSEREWQAFFEEHKWIFGHGLNYVFLDKVGAKLEARTTGNTFDQGGKTVDGLLRTRAEISQYVLVEIKKDGTPLLRTGEPYRAGCWGVSDEVSNAVTQIQKTAWEFARTRFRGQLKDKHGNDLDEAVYAVQPRSYLVIGDLAELSGNDDKVACFELYRRNVHSPEILTFDELYHRASFIVANLANEEAGTDEDACPF
jgi:hypothetical protein